MFTISIMFNKHVDSRWLKNFKPLTIYLFHHAQQAYVLFTTLTLFNMFIMLTKVGAMFAQKSTLTPEMQLVLDQVETIDEECTQNGTAIILDLLLSSENVIALNWNWKLSFISSQEGYILHDLRNNVWF